MCGVFYVDDDTAREIEKIVRKVDEQLKEKYKAKDRLLSVMEKVESTVGIEYEE